MFIPYRAEVELKSPPLANLFILLFTSAFYFTAALLDKPLGSFTTDGFNTSLLVAAFMHADVLHLLGNMFYLWIFGNAICSRLGNLNYPGIYMLLAIFASFIHQLFDGAPAVGASGAVNGVIGCYLFYYPKSRIDCMFTIPYFFGKKFTMNALWLIAFWFLADLYGAIWGESSIGYIAHLGGFVGGFLAGWLTWYFGWTKASRYEPTILQLMK